MGYKVPGWDDDFFSVLDIARRVGSGVGSFGVDRFYVLLEGRDQIGSNLMYDYLANDLNVKERSVILDVKFEPR